MYLNQDEWEDPYKIRQQAIAMGIGTTRVFDKTGVEISGNAWESQIHERMLRQRKILRDLMTDRQEYEEMWRLRGQSPTEEEKDYLVTQESLKKISDPSFSERLYRSFGALLAGGPQAAFEALDQDRKIYSSPIRDRDFNIKMGERYDLKDKGEWGNYLKQLEGKGLFSLPDKEDWNSAKLPEESDTDYHLDVWRAERARQALLINRIPHFIMRAMGYDPLTKEEEERLEKVRGRSRGLTTILDMAGGWIGSREAGRRYMENIDKIKANPELATIYQRINIRSFKQVQLSKIGMMMRQQYNGKYQRDLMVEAERLQKEIREISRRIPEGAGTVREIFGGRFDPFKQLAYFWGEQGPMLFDIIGSGIEAGLDETKGIQLENRWWNQTLKDVGDVALTALLPVGGKGKGLRPLAGALGASAKALQRTVRFGMGAGIGLGAGSLGTGSAYADALLENVKIPIFADEDNEYRSTSSGAQLVKYPGADIYTEFVSQPGYVNGRRIVGFSVHGMPEDIARKISLVRGLTEGIGEFLGAVGIPGLKGSGLIPSKIMKKFSIQASGEIIGKNLFREVVVPSAMRMTREAGLQVTEEVLQELGGHYFESNIRKTANALRGTSFEIDENEWKRVAGETLDRSILGALSFVAPTASINFGLELKSFKEGRSRFEYLPGGKEFFVLHDKDISARTFDDVIDNNAHKLSDKVKITIGDLPEDIKTKIEKGELSLTDLHEHELTEERVEKLLKLSQEHSDHITAKQFRGNVHEQSSAKLNSDQKAFKDNLEISKKIATDHRNLSTASRRLSRNSKEAHAEHNLGDRIQYYDRRQVYLEEWITELTNEMEGVEGKDKIPYSDIIQENNTILADNIQKRADAIKEIRGRRKKGDVDVVQEYTSDPELGVVKLTMTLTEGDNIHWRVEKYNEGETELELTEDYDSLEDVMVSLSTDVPVNTKLKMVEASLGARTGSTNWRKKGVAFTLKPASSVRRNIFAAAREKLPEPLKSVQDRLLSRLRDVKVGTIKGDVITTQGLMGYITSGAKISLGEWIVDNINRFIPEGERRLGITSTGRKRVVDPEAIIWKDLSPKERAKRFKANKPLFKFLVSKVGTREDIIQRLNKSIRDYMRGMVGEVNTMGINTITKLQDIVAQVENKQAVLDHIEAINLHMDKVKEGSTPKAIDDALRVQARKNLLEGIEVDGKKEDPFPEKSLTKKIIANEVDRIKAKRAGEYKAVLLKAIGSVAEPVAVLSRGIRTINQLGTIKNKKVVDFSTLELRQVDRIMQALVYSAHQVVQKNTITVSGEARGTVEVVNKVVGEIEKFNKRSSESIRENKIRKVWNVIKRTGLRFLPESTFLNVLAHKDSIFRRVVMLDQAVTNTRRIQGRFSKNLQRSIKKHLGELPANTEFSKYMNEKVKGLKLIDENGKVHTREMNKDKLISLYLHFQNPSNTRHITPQPLEDGSGSVETVGIGDRRSKSIPGLIFRDKYVGFNSENALNFFIEGKDGKARMVSSEEDLRIVDEKVRTYLAENMEDIDLKYAEAIKEFYASHWNEVNAFYRELNGIDLSRVERYFPLSVGRKYATKPETVTKDKAERSDQYGDSEILPPESMTIEREFSSGAIYLDGVLRVINKSIHDSGSYMGLTKPVADARNMIRHSKVGDELIKFDKDIPDLLEKNINDTIRFQIDSSNLELVDKTFAWFRRNATKSFLSLNWAVSVAQSLSYAAAATYLETGYLWKAVAMDLDRETSNAFDKTFKELSGLYLERIAGLVDRDVAPRMGARAAVATVTGKPVLSLVDKGLFAVRFFDRITVRKVMMAGVLQAMDQMESGNITEDFITNTGMNRQALVEIMDQGNKMEQLPIAIRFAESVVERSQPMFNPAHRSALSNTKNELTKMFTPFRGWQDAVLGLVVREAVSLKRGDKGAPRRLATALFSTMIVGSMGMWALHSLRTHLRNLLRDEEKEPDSVWDKLFDSVTGPVPFVGGLMQNLHYQLQRIKEDGRIQPIKIFGESLAAQPISELEDLIYHVWKYFDADSDRWRGYHALQAVKQILMTMILVTGLPYSTKQAIDLMIKAIED